MSTSKHIDKICALAAVLALLLCIVLMCLPAEMAEKAGKTLGYEDKLFDTSRVHTIDIRIDDWDSFIASAESEEYSLCTLVIDGETVANVGIRGKGNTSLTSVASMDSSRYSFKVEFDQYDSGISYHGLDKLSLNNLIQDASYMKDYLTYRLMAGFGVAAPLCSFAQLSVNGEVWGLYLAVEGVEDSFLQRNYGSGHGELYKPDSMDMGGGRGMGKDFSMESFRADAPESLAPSRGEAPQMPGGSVPPQMPTGGTPNSNREEPPGMGGSMEKEIGGMGSSDVLLQYTGDDFSSYSNIFDNAKTDISDADKARLIAGLKTLSSGENIDSAVDIDAVIRYFVVHNFVVNGDSYTGGMVHNYYLYEDDGILSMIPWDYNLAYGTFQGSSATEAVNDHIDSPLSVSGSGRPMIDWIFASEEYTAKYHEYFSEFLASADIDSIISEACALISPYVQSDPTAFYGYDEFVSAVDALREFCRLRCQSVQNQLSGLDEPVKADHLNLSDMGSMNMGGAQPEKPGENAFPDRENSRPGNEGSPQSSFSNLLLVPICVIMLLAAILIAWKYKRKKHG